MNEPLFVEDAADRDSSLNLSLFLVPGGDSDPLSSVWWLIGFMAQMTRAQLSQWYLSLLTKHGDIFYQFSLFYQQWLIARKDG